MGQKANPISNRLGIIRGWDSNWFADKDYAANVVEDEKIRRYLKARVISSPGREGEKTKAAKNKEVGLKDAIARIVIERSLKRVIVTIHTSRPGVIIGKNGTEVEEIRRELKKLTDKDVQINIIEISKPDLDANVVGESIAKQLEGRVNYRRAVKMAIVNTMRAGAEGIKFRISGRLNGAEIARSEEFKHGRTPLHTFRADIDYAIVEGLTVDGKIGIKVWICRGEIYGRPDLNPNIGNVKEARGEGGGNDRGGRRDGGRGGNDRGGRREGGRGGNDRGGRGGNDRGGRPAGGDRGPRAPRG